ncbi:ATP-dependent nuclease [Streptomyces parvulus]|uniref:ATP-dependent nuclease n=1 Tax=Streptomyces parvulus TaxID=146923 RepID=UPI0033B41DC1
MQLSRVRVKNFRNFKDLTIDPFPSPAVIVGENGVGKSNLLAALRLVLDPELLDRHRVLDADDVYDGSLGIVGGAEVSVEVELSGFDDDADARAVLDGAIVSLAPLTARLTYLFRPRQRAIDADTSGADSDVPEGELTAADYEWTIFGSTDPGNSMRDVKRYAAFSVLPALRDTEQDLARPDRSPLTRLLRELPPAAENLERTLAVMRQARAELAKDDNVQKLTQQLTERITALAGPRMSMSPTLDFAGREEDLLRRVQLYIDAAGTRTIDRTSTGMANVLYLAMLLERLEIRRVTEDGEDTLLAVEEPEAHLHPTLQRHLFFHLLRNLSRLMLTTHSPHIAAVTPLTSLVLMYEENDQIQARSVPKALLEERERKDLERYLNVSRAEMLFARGIVLVEGIAEAYLVPALASAAGLDLDAHGIVVANIEGTDFVPYARLLGPTGLKRSFWILTDGDQTNLDPQQHAHLREGGLTRAVDVLDVLSPADGERMRTTLETMRLAELPEDGSAREGRDDLVAAAAQHRVFVGEHTLEIDLARLLDEEMRAAFDELVEGPVARGNFADALRAALSTTTPQQRREVLSRIEKKEVSKGRYAQRLAAHVEQVGDLATRVRTLVGVAPDQPVTQTMLMQMGGCGPLLALLDQLCRNCLGRPLAPGVEMDAQPAVDVLDAG